MAHPRRGSLGNRQSPTNLLIVLSHGQFQHRRLLDMWITTIPIIIWLSDCDNFVIRRLLGIAIFYLLGMFRTSWSSHHMWTSGSLGISERHARCFTLSEVPHQGLCQIIRMFEDMDARDCFGPYLTKLLRHNWRCRQPSPYPAPSSRNLPSWSNRVLAFSFPPSFFSFWCMRHCVVCGFHVRNSLPWSNEVRSTPFLKS